MPKVKKRKSKRGSPRDLTGTHESLNQRVALTKIFGSAIEESRTIIGWEYAPPKRGERYSIYLGKGKYLRSSTVEDITSNPHSLMIKTANSLYEIKYLD